MNDLDYAKQIFNSGAYSFVVANNGSIIATGERDGIGELLDAITLHGSALHGAVLADRIVGKAVAMIAVGAGIRAVYTPLASEPALQVLTRYTIPLEAGCTVPLILNKRNDGMCPMERLTMPLDEPAQAIAALREFVAARPAVIPSVPFPQP